MARKLVLACRQSRKGLVKILSDAWEFLISSSVHFPQKREESSLSLFVVIVNLNSPRTTWLSNLEINRLRVWTHMHISVLWEGDKKEERGKEGLLLS